MIGIDEEGRPPRAICPNCGQNEMECVPAVECNGDRVLVQKFLDDFRPPRRWEVAVFHFPGDPSQAYVKRVVGLPGESVQIVGGNVLIDGQDLPEVAPQELRAMQILVHDSRFTPRDSDRYPRFYYLRGWPRHRLPSGWQHDGGRVRPRTGLLPFRASSSRKTGWLSGTGTRPNWYGPIRHHYAYNGGDLEADNIVPDLYRSRGA